VVFSKKGGLIDGPINLILSGIQQGEIIRYETGGLKPTESSPEYINPININSNTSVRARIFSENKIPSPIYTESYILSNNHDMDVILMTVEPNDFFHADTGIYVFGPEGTFDQNIPFFGANFWEDWERPIHFSFHENGKDTSCNQLLNGNIERIYNEQTLKKVRHKEPQGYSIGFIEPANLIGLNF
jgi:hypothetical protein